MLESPQIAEALRSYVMETAPLLALKLDASPSQRVTEVNAQARAVFGAAVVGRPFAEQFVNFRGTLDLPALVQQGSAVHPLTVSTAAGMPETLGFRFFPLAEGTLVVGSLDFAEQQALRNQVLAQNHELNNLARQLHQANAELRDLNQLKNQFLGMAAHDLRKPIGLILTYSEFVLDEAADQLSPEHLGFLRTCQQAASGMKQLIDGFLDVSVIESGQLRLNLELTSVEKILGGVEPVARLLAQKKKLTLLVEVAEATRRVRGDAGKLQQVLVNLVGNAVEHSVPGQRVWLSARWEEQQLVFAVRDEGPGLTPEEQARLFQAFARAGTRKTAGERSTGLGLAIARLIVEAHGGRIWVESLPGQGATFLFTLPLQPSTPTVQNPIPR